MRLHALDGGLVEVLVAQAMGIGGEPIRQRSLPRRRCWRCLMTLGLCHRRCHGESYCTGKEVQQSAAGKVHSALPVSARNTGLAIPARDALGRLLLRKVQTAVPGCRGCCNVFTPA